MDTRTRARWQEIPTVDASSGPRRQVARAPAGYTRRRFLQGVSTMGGALALTVLGGMPTLRPRAALATPGTEHLGCANYDLWSGYNDDTEKCVGAIYSSYYCGADKWFKDGGYNPSFHPTTACGAGGLDQRNAWRWTHSGTPYRCADGYMCGSSGCVFRICSAANP